ncbi:MAG: hypothetical protein ACN6RG_02480 [Stenotrophomonas sp.]|uniref:hypothetical protein n=1 Tax=unclassified Stenotrophomonas TaxID=196198 RepID=UPI00177E1040|nr:MULTISPECIES: hypothetical protein [unclassified Stenotrophomonas]MBD9536335.1 hypothetical protein [Stenotrophomonas sp. STM01]
MKLPRLAVLAAFTALSLSPLLPAHAQRVVHGDLQQQMSPAEFKAAGLDKLNAEELAALNNWLQGKVEQAASVASAAVEQAREEGRQEVIVKNRGFFDFGSRDPIVAKLEGEFRGFGKGRQYTLDNGQVWEQTDEASVSGVRRDMPTVEITPGLMNVWYLRVEGLNTRAKVRRTK